MDVSQLAQTVAIYALPVLFAITLHEAAHGYVARHFGDMTAFAQRRISLNPLRHIDPIGTVVVPLGILFLTKGAFLFGWAKPVPVNFSALRRPRQHMALVAAAGPGANLFMALCWTVIYHVAPLLPSFFGTPLYYMGEAGIRVNLVLMFLNLLPILPLDGGRIVACVLPVRAAWQYARLEPFGLPILLLMMFTDVLGKVLGPLVIVSESLLR